MLSIEQLNKFTKAYIGRHICHEDDGLSCYRCEQNDAVEAFKDTLERWMSDGCPDDVEDFIKCN